jgi:hypothetical protein
MPKPLFVTTSTGGKAMKIEPGKGKTEFGPGVSISLSGAEVAIAIDEYLIANSVAILGPRTIRINGELIISGSVYVDPSGTVVAGGTEISGRYRNG